MLQKPRRGRQKMHVVATVLLVFFFTRTEAATLKGNAEEKGQKEATEVTSGYKPGVVEFGKGPKPPGKDDPSFQADDPGWFKAQQDFKAMPLSLMCGPNDMKMMAFGGLSKYFIMNQLPPSCRYSMRWHPFGLVVRVPYDGCNVEIAGGYYNFPLLWNGLPVTAKCIKDDPPMRPPFLPPWFPWPLPQEPTTVAPTIPLFPPGLHHHHPLWPYPQNPFMPYPGPFWPPFFHKHPLVPTTSAPPQDSQLQHWWWHKFPHYQSPSAPTSTPNYFQQFHQHLKYPFGNPGMAFPTKPSP